MKLNWRTIGELLAVTSVVISLIFVGFELRLSRSAAETEAFGNSAEIETAYRDLLASHAEIWHRGCIDEDLSDVEELIFAQVLQSYMNLSFMKWLRSQRGVTESPQDAHVITIALSMHQFPGFEKRWKEFAEAQNEKLWIVGITSREPGDFYMEIERHYQNYRSAGRRVDVSTAYCGLTS